MSQKLVFITTRTGQTFFLLGLFLFLAGYNTGNNNLFLLATGDLCLFFMAFLAAYRNLQGLTITFDSPPECFARRDTYVTAWLTEVDGRPRYSLSLGQDYVWHLGAFQKFPFRVRVHPTHRGLQKIGEIVLTSLFPFGFFEFRIPCHPLEIQVFPAIKPSKISGDAAGAVPRSDSKVDSSGDYWMHRPYLPGEDARYIQWQVSARGETEYVVSKTIQHQEPMRVWVDFSEVKPESFELFLEQLTGFLLYAHGLEAVIWSWFPGSPGTGDWISLKDRQGRDRWLAYLSTVTPQTALTLAPPAAPDATAIHPGQFEEISEFVFWTGTLNQ